IVIVVIVVSLHVVVIQRLRFPQFFTFPFYILILQLPILASGTFAAFVAFASITFIFALIFTFIFVFIIRPVLFTVVFVVFVVSVVTIIDIYYHVVYILRCEDGDAVFSHHLVLVRVRASNEFFPDFLCHLIKPHEDQ